MHPEWQELQRAIKQMLTERMKFHKGSLQDPEKTRIQEKECELLLETFEMMTEMGINLAPADPSYWQEYWHRLSF